MHEKIDLVSQPKSSFWKLSIPIIAFCIFDAIYGIIDMLWVSQISVEAFYAIGISIPITSLIFSFGDSIGQGTNSMISRFIGSGDYESAYNTLIHGIIITNIVWVIVMLCLVFAQGALYTLKQGDSYILIFDYLVPIIIFAYVFMLTSLFSETMQAEGNSRTPTILMVGSNILNIILDPIFIFNFNLGIQGAAIATVLSSMVPFTIFMYLYVHGKTKIPLERKYFKFNSYILVEIFKVTLPNFLDDGMWTFAMSYVNSILVMTMGDIGPILYSVSTKLRSLLIAPVRGYGRGLMSVTGHLFGAEKFDELEKMFNYVLKIAIITILIVMIVFVFLRDYAFAIFSITGMENEIFWIAVGGIITMLATTICSISAKMLDGFGKSLYSLVFTIIEILSGMAIMAALAGNTPSGSCVLIGIILSGILAAIINYLFLRHLFRNFGEEYKFKYTVKTFNIKRKEKIEKLMEEKQRRKDEFKESMEAKKQDRIERKDRLMEEKQRRKDEFKESMEEKKQDRIERKDKIVEKLKKKENE